MTTLRALSFSTPSAEIVSATLQQPANSVGLLVLGHGSGSNMHVPLMAELSAALSLLGVATLRFEYPYSDLPSFVPFTDMPMDPDDVLIATVRAALDLANREVHELPIFVGGHSVSGFISTVADADVSLPAKAIVSLSYPRKGDASRSEHLDATTLPILFIQGTLDTLGTKAELANIVDELGERSTIKWIEGATHGFEVEGRDFRGVIDEIARHIHDYITEGRDPG